MGIFSRNIGNQKNESVLNRAEQFGLTVAEFEKLSLGKSCPKYGLAEALHIRRTRGGKIVVFNISEKYRSEKISEGRKNIKVTNSTADTAINENDQAQD